MNVKKIEMLASIDMIHREMSFIVMCTIPSLLGDKMEIAFFLKLYKLPIQDY